MYLMLLQLLTQVLYIDEDAFSGVVSTKSNTQVQTSVIVHTVDPAKKTIPAFSGTFYICTFNF